MQDIHSFEITGGGRLFSAGGDRRLRPQQLGQSPPLLKCPRCESSNTKFCYYNNYNLSQPRHFCKNCRRYWTKGGVLRSIPVGGGCRKNKRAKTNTTKPDDSPKELKASNSQNSSSESSSLTVSTTAVPPQTTAAKNLSSLFSIPKSIPTNPSLDPPLMDQSSESCMLPEIEALTTLMTSSHNPTPLGFNMTDMSSYRSHQQQSKDQVVEDQISDQQHWQQLEQHQHQKIMEDETSRLYEFGGGYLNQTAETEFTEMQNKTNDGALAAVNWQSEGNYQQGLFDLGGTVDHSYWNQSQWPDHDHQLNYLS